MWLIHCIVGGRVRCELLYLHYDAVHLSMWVIGLITMQRSLMFKVKAALLLKRWWEAEYEWAVREGTHLTVAPCQKRGLTIWWWIVVVKKRTKSCPCFCFVGVNVRNVTQTQVLPGLAQRCPDSTEPTFISFSINDMCISRTSSCPAGSSIPAQLPWVRTYHSMSVQPSVTPCSNTELCQGYKEQLIIYKSFIW